jgi:hypothetical protein
MKELSNESSDFDVDNVKPDQTVRRMAEAPFEKIFVLSEKGWALQAMQQYEVSSSCTPSREISFPICRKGIRH